jgi:hypothetical protein
VRLETAGSRHQVAQLEPKDSGPWSQVRVRDCISWHAAPELVFQLNLRAATARRDRHGGRNWKAPISGPVAEISRREARACSDHPPWSLALPPCPSQGSFGLYVKPRPQARTWASLAQREPAMGSLASGLTHRTDPPSPPGQFRVPARSRVSMRRNLLAAARDSANAGNGRIE